jgi:fumarate hydratase subunit beta
MSEPQRIRAPLTKAEALKLRAGEPVLISGTLYTARDAAHKRMVEALGRGEQLPFDPTDQLIYYVGPTPPRPGQVLGAAGPTTASRMDPYLEALLAAGVRGSIGKGQRAPAVRDLCRCYGAVYFVGLGGAGALVARTIRKAELVAWEDLGTEAVRRLEVVDFPALVGNDAHGGDAFVSGQARWRREPA